jgi:hypothetical protein
VEGRGGGGKAIAIVVVDSLLLLNLQAFQVGKVLAPVARRVSRVASWQLLAARYQYR